MSDLILVPTQRELDSVRDQLKVDSSAVQRIGFGPISSAVRTAALIARYKPSRVLLVGIAGAFDTQTHPIGSAHRFDHVRCDGIGAGTGSDFQSASELGWMQFAADDLEDQSTSMPAAGDGIALVSTYNPLVPCAGSLLTVCAASASTSDRNARRERFPDVVAEDMEGFSVAMACLFAAIPVQIVRGISNQVGDRDLSNWQIDTALATAAKLASEVLSHPWVPATV
jgi:futalosine hydrolase